MTTTRRTSRFGPLMRRGMTAVVTAAVIGGLTVATAPTAAAAEISGPYTFEMNTTGATITDYSGPGGALAIPTTLKMGLVFVPVTAIGDNAFKQKALTALSLPNSVTALGKAAFAENDLTTVIIPNSVTSMEDDVFFGNNLASLTLSAALTSIPPNAFSGNELTSVVIPPSVTTIEGSAFYGNPLTSIDLGSVATIGPSAFAFHRAASVTIPATVGQIGAEAFLSINTLGRVLFAGNAPTLAAPAGANGPFDNSAAPAATVYVNADAHGYAFDAQGRWQGYDAVPVKLAAMVDATSVKQGGKVTITGAGAYPGATVTARLDGVSSSPLGSSTATNDGKFAFQAAVPAATALNAHTLYLTSPFAGTTVQQQIPIIVIEGAAAPGPTPADCTVKPFADVKTTNSNCAGITWMKDSGTMPSTKAKYKPGNQLNRRVAAQFLYRMTHTAAAPACAVKVFKDMGKNAKFCGFAQWAVGNGIIKPTKAMKFKPKKAVTRGQLADMLYRLDHSGAAAPRCAVKPLKDVKKGNKYCGAISWAVVNDLIPAVGKKAVTFKPGRVLKRGQTATILHAMSVYLG